MLRTQLLIATQDSDYAAHLSGVISEKHADVLDVSVCGSPEHLAERLKSRVFDVALMDGDMLGAAAPQSVRVPLLLRAEEDNDAPRVPEGCQIIRKYQRISSLVAGVLEICARSPALRQDFSLKRARVTAVWSPAGGVGKTTAALAYCERQSACGRHVLYLNLEPFSSTAAYFPQSGMSISGIFEMLESEEGSVSMLIKSAQQRCSNAKITYFLCPENYDDMNIITPQNVEKLIDACAGAADELVIDMSCACDERAARAFACSDRIFLVTDPSSAAQAKLSQFVSQHDTFRRVREKLVLVANKGADAAGAPVDYVISLPFIKSPDAPAVCKTLSSVNFDI